MFFFVVQVSHQDGATGPRGQVQYPFSTDIEEGGIPPDGSQEILVDFDPGYKARKSWENHGKIHCKWRFHGVFFRIFITSMFWMKGVNIWCNSWSQIMDYCRVVAFIKQIRSRKCTDVFDVPSGYST